MARYVGLRGSKLNSAIWGVFCVAVMILFDYNQAAAGGVLTTPSFAEAFLKMDTLDTMGSQKHYNSLIQGPRPS